MQTPIGWGPGLEAGPSLTCLGSLSLSGGTNRDRVLSCTAMAAHTSSQLHAHDHPTHALACIPATTVMHWSWNDIKRQLSPACGWSSLGRLEMTDRQCTDRCMSAIHSHPCTIPCFMLLVYIN